MNIKNQSIRSMMFLFAATAVTVAMTAGSYINKAKFDAVEDVSLLPTSVTPATGRWEPICGYLPNDQEFRVLASGDVLFGAKVPGVLTVITNSREADQEMADHGYFSRDQGRSGDGQTYWTVQLNGEAGISIPYDLSGNSDATKEMIWETDYGTQNFVITQEEVVKMCESEK